MFSFRFGQSLNVHSASQFNDTNGNPAFCIILYECENQPEGIERPSKSKYAIKIWGNGSLPEEMHNGCKMVVESAAGFDVKHVTRKNRKGETIYDADGNPVFESHTELVAPVIKVLDPINTTKKSKKKAEG